MMARKSDVESMKEKQQQAYSSCLQKIEQWEKFRKDYEILKGRLETLPDKISYEVMVPFGSHAFIPGHLIHTNEVITLLGANWFAEMSAKHAAEVSKRRIDQCEKMLIDLKEEKEQCEHWLHFISETMCNDLVDIHETCNEEEEKQWQEQHAKNLKVHKQSEAGRISSSSQQKCEGDSKETTEDSGKDYFQLLEDLEEQESRRGELNESITDEEDNHKHNCDDVSDSDEDDTEGKKDEDSSEEYCKSNGKHVKWKDQEGEKMKNRITFTHSSHKSKNRSNSKPIFISKAKSKTKDHVPLSPVKIQNPADIYKCFSTKPEQCKPKSILKRRTSLDDSDVLTESETECVAMRNEDDDMPVLKARFKEQTAFTGEIIEHKMEQVNSSDTTEAVAQRPPSRFKTRRQNKQ